MKSIRYLVIDLRGQPAQQPRTEDFFDTRPRPSLRTTDDRRNRPTSFLHFIIMNYDLTIPDHARTMFGTSWLDAAQQKVSRLRPYLNVRTGCTGNSIVVDIDGIIEGSDVTGQRYKNVEINDTQSLIRYIYPKEYQEASHMSRWDPSTIAPLVSPAGQQTKKHSAAFGRFVDRLVLSQILGDASQATSNNPTPQVIALPNGQKIAKDFVSSGSAAESGLTVDKIIRAKEILEENEHWNDDKAADGVTLCMAINAKTQSSLLRSVESSLGARLMSSDYAKPVIDENGYIREFLGIKFIRTELVSTITDADDRVALCPLWVSDAVELAFWEDMSITIDRLPTKSQAIQFLSQARLGCARIYDEGVVQIACRTGAA